MSADNGSVHESSVDDLTFDIQHDNDMLSINREQVNLINLGIDDQDRNIELIPVKPSVEFIHDLGTSTNPRSRPLATHTYELDHGLSKS